MACVEAPALNADSEMEEGEIVDEPDDLSDISSEEEFLLRQRLQVLENYNNVLERKEAKRTSIGSGSDRLMQTRIMPKLPMGTNPWEVANTQNRRVEALYDQSDISGANADNGLTKLTLRITREHKHSKPQIKQRRLKQNVKESSKIKEHRRKNRHIKKKITVISDSDISDVSEDEYRNKRRRLEDAVSLSKVKHDTTTLKDRITKMLCGSKAESSQPIEVLPKITEGPEIPKAGSLEIENKNEQINLVSEEKLHEISDLNDPSHLTAEQDKPNESPLVVVDSVVVESKEDTHSDANSDEDLELLRQLALKTKTAKLAMPNDKISTELRPPILSEDEDSDTAELRMICLKSAFLKKAIEIKQKQKLQKRLSQSSIVPDDFDIQKAENDMNVDNNTDIESVDMDIGSDAEDKGKIVNDCHHKTEIKSNNNVISQENVLKDELDDDEDLLRAKLLTSLSKNLPNLVGLNVLDTVLAKPETKTENTTKTQPQQEEKKFIIQLRESDSEGENEATKNLTRMHIKLSEQQEFQNKLDLFLKTTRMEVEKKNKLPNVVQDPVQKSPQKFVVKAMNHLPKSEQVEYRNLVKRMAELEKLKQARQNAVNKIPMVKDTLKPRNMSLEAYKIAYAKKIEDKIAQSRKKIAEESDKMLKLKEEATKLSQRYKIVATELRNIATAITINKKQQRVVQNGLSRIRHQHQMLIKSSPTRHSSSQNIQIGRPPDKIISTAKLQKENNPSKEEHKNPTILKSVKVSVVNNLSNENVVHPKLSVQLDISNNKKVVKMPKSPLKDRVVDIKRISPEKTSALKNEALFNTSILEKELPRRKSKDETETHNVITTEYANDYRSPLDSLQCKNWEEDPNGVLCPFEVGGSCRDPDCKYLHPKPHKTE